MKLRVKSYFGFKLPSFVLIIDETYSFMNSLKLTLTRAILMFALTIAVTIATKDQAIAQMRIQIGTDSLVSSAGMQPSPFADFYMDHRIQYLIKKSELTAGGLTTQRTIQKIAFHVVDTTKAKNNFFTIKMMNTTAGELPLSGFISGATQVFTKASYRDSVGWCFITLDDEFEWDGSSNVLVEICRDASSYNVGSRVYYHATSFRSEQMVYIDYTSGNVCTRHNPYNYKMYFRPTMILEFKDLNAPPVAKCKNFEVTLEDGSYTIQPEDIDDGSYAYPSTSALYVTPDVMTCSNIGENVVTLTIVDTDGDTAQCEATVTVKGAVHETSQYTTLLDIDEWPFEEYPDEQTIYLGYGPDWAYFDVDHTTSLSLKYRWYPGDGDELEDASFLGGGDDTRIFAPEEAGDYTFYCETKNQFGCTKTEKFRICVIDPHDEDNAMKMYVCHDGRTISVNVSSISAHLAHGDILGSCDADRCFDAFSSAMPVVINEHELVIPEFSVHPNPSSSSFSFRLLSTSEEAYSIQIHDIFGRLIAMWDKLTPGEEIVLDNELSAGMYHATAIQGKLRKTIKIGKN